MNLKNLLVEIMTKTNEEFSILRIGFETFHWELSFHDYEVDFEILNTRQQHDKGKGCRIYSYFCIK